MTINHYLLTSIPSIGVNTQACWARQASGHAIIFVHGFGGKSLLTWDDFSGLLPIRQKCVGCDLIFYGYDGLHSRATHSAADLRDFIHAFFNAPLNIINSSLPDKDARTAPFNYSRITLVAHSLGAIISRDALLQGYKKGEAWAPYTELVLFAPAHSGANIIPLIRQSLLAPFWFFIPLVQLFKKYVVLQDLEPGSLMLQYLLTETKNQLAQGALTLIALKVLIAGKDNIVHPIPFANDPPPNVIHGRTHIDVCKPDPTFLQPVIEVLNVI